MAVDLVTSRHLHRDEPARCYGVYALDIDNQRVETLPAAAVVLATGGVGKVYRYTTNPDTSTGDGIAMAWRAGCRIGNMEFVQFHPTCLYHPKERSFLITEALRGEGAQLKLPDGTRFMADHDAAPRAGAARHRRPGDRLRDEEARPRPRLARRHAPRRGIPEGALPDRPRPLPRARHRHRPPADPGGARGPLHLRRRRDRPRRPDRPAGPVRRRRGDVHRPPRRQPARQQLAARVRRRRADLRGADRRRAARGRGRRSRPGTRAGSRTPTSRS